MLYVTSHRTRLLTASLLTASLGAALASSAMAAPQKGRLAARFQTIGGVHSTSEAPTGRRARSLPVNDDYRASTRMAAMMGTSPAGCLNPGANPVTTNESGDLSVGGVACAGGGISTENSYARVFSQSVVGAAYTINCVNFGVENTGSPIDGVLGVYIDPTGGDPSVSELQPVGVANVSLTTGASQLLTASFDPPLCVELDAGETLVVVLDYGPSSDGFCSFAGGNASSSPTYILSASCGVSDFLDLALIGFPNNQWYVELSGDFGCGGSSIPGDLNDDGVVDGTDLSILLGAWGTADPIADITGDGDVNGSDLAVVLGNWTG